MKFAIKQKATAKEKSSAVAELSPESISHVRFYSATLKMMAKGVGTHYNSFFLKSLYILQNEDFVAVIWLFQVQGNTNLTHCCHLHTSQNAPIQTCIDSLTRLYNTYYFSIGVHREYELYYPVSYNRHIS